MVVKRSGDRSILAGMDGGNFRALVSQFPSALKLQSVCIPRRGPRPEFLETCEEYPSTKSRPMLVSKAIGAKRAPKPRSLY